MTSYQILTPIKFTPTARQNNDNHNFRKSSYYDYQNGSRQVSDNIHTRNITIKSRLSDAIRAPNYNQSFNKVLSNTSNHPLRRDREIELTGEMYQWLKVNIEKTKIVHQNVGLDQSEPSPHY